MASKTVSTRSKRQIKYSGMTFYVLIQSALILLLNLLNPINPGALLIRNLLNVDREFLIYKHLNM